MEAYATQRRYDLVFRQSTFLFYFPVTFSYHIEAIEFPVNCCADRQAWDAIVAWSPAVNEYSFSIPPHGTQSCILHLVPPESWLPSPSTEISRRTNVGSSADPSTIHHSDWVGRVGKVHSNARSWHLRDKAKLYPDKSRHYSTSRHNSASSSRNFNQEKASLMSCQLHL